MKTKTIFKTLAFAMLMPAMMLTTACSSDNDSIINDEITTKKGYPLQVTINVTRQGDATTRATYTDNGDKTGSLAFSSGDKLFVKGYASETAGGFAGTLTMVSVSEGTFSGTIYTQNAYSGTADALLTEAGSVRATLLPDGYSSYGYLPITIQNGYDDFLFPDDTKAFATSTSEKTAKAIAVEQFSYETSTTYSSGFTLSPLNAILNFNITGLTASTEVTASFTDDYSNVISGNVTTDGSGNATFAIGVIDNTNLQYCSLTVDGKAITLPSKTLTAGKIYNITRSAVPAAASKALSVVTSSEVGWRIGSDGIAYEATGTLPTGVTAVAIIAYVGTAGSVDDSNGSYKGLAIAMSNANDNNDCIWWADTWGDGYNNCLSSTDDLATALGYKNGITCTSTLTASGHSGHDHAAAAAAASNNGIAAPPGTSGWFLPSLGQWNLILQGLATKKAGTAVTTDLSNSDNANYKSSYLASVINAAGGDDFDDYYYWTSTEYDSFFAWFFGSSQGYADYGTKRDDGNYVRSVLAF